MVDFSNCVPCGVAIAAMFESHGSQYVLLGKRKAGHGKGKWGLPGGRIEPTDVIVEDAACRELYEETGIYIDLDELKIASVPWNITTEDSGECWVTLFFEVHLQKLISAKVNEPDKCECWEYYDVKCLPHPLFKPFEVFAQAKGWI